MEDKKPFLLNSEDIQTKLDKRLGPEYISKRVGYGSNKVAYIEGWKAINLANQIFGYNGWSTEVKNVTIDFLDERQGKYSIGCTATVRVTLASGTFREDIGYGTVENERRKAAAFERAKKSAVTDALKRSLRAFGNALGNCLYDKTFLSQIDKVKFDPPDFDEDDLFRPSDEISEITRSNTLDHESRNGGSNKRRQLTKIAVNNGTAVKVENRTMPVQQTNKPQQNVHPLKQDAIASTTEAPNANQYNDELLDDSLMYSDDFQDDDLMNLGNKGNSTEDGQQREPQAPENITFVTAKAATFVQNNKKITEENVFDPKYKAQSIKHTIDQTSSTHIPASVLKEKGVNGPTDSVYQKFAPKGKGLAPSAKVIASSNHSSFPEPLDERVESSESNSSKPTVPNTAPNEVQNSSVLHNPTNANNRFAPPSNVVHPNSYIPPIPSKNNRREVGRPKVNPLQLRKQNP